MKQIIQVPAEIDKAYKVFHFRLKYDDRSISSKGGVTAVYSPTDKIISLAVCSRRENYNKKYGRYLAIDRLLKFKRGEGRKKVKGIVRLVNEVEDIHDLEKGILNLMSVIGVDSRQINMPWMVNSSVLIGKHGELTPCEKMAVVGTAEALSPQV